jgi:aldehyde:ferredoxin oxidoreductase
VTGQAYGWTGTILEIDLSSRTQRLVRPDIDRYHTFIGGKGLAGTYLGPCMTLDYRDPDMPIALFAGPLVGTAAPTSGRMTIMSRSPLTGTVGDGSVGGKLGTQIKRAGLDGIVVTGESTTWVGVEIEDGEVRWSDATGLVGLPVGKVMAGFSNKGAVALVGPAAENGVRFSSIMVDRHFTAGRGGLGLSFAAKKLKYIAVKGSGRVTVCDPQQLKKERQDIFRLIAASPVLKGEYGIANWGTPALYDLMHARRMMPTGNFKKTFFPPAPGLNAHALSARYHPKRSGCRGCHILCKKKSDRGEPLPEFETLSHFTALVENDDLEAAFRANILCNEYGMDTVSAGSTLACYQELSGDRLTPATILHIIEEMGQGVGLGKELGQGSLSYAQERGRPELSMSVKGLELPAYDPRGAYGMALAYVTSTRGGCHLRAYPISHEILRKPVVTDRFSFSGKARIIKIAEDLNAIVDSLNVCKFAFFASSLEEYAKVFTAVTGVEMTAHGLSEIGERIYYNERMMNARVGFDAKDDDLPPRFFDTPGTDGPCFDVPAIDRDRFLACRQKYYRVRGLDDNGLPTQEKAEALGLSWNV